MNPKHLNKNISGNNNPCVWMQANVIRKKDCLLDYECSDCRFDTAMRRVSGENRKLKEHGRTPRGKRGEIVFWKDKLRELPVWKRPCTHYLMGRIDFKGCTNDYKCGNCEFDQFFLDQYSVHAVVKPVDVLDVEGFKIPQGFYLHKGHTWIKIENGSSVRIGLDDFALRLMGPLDEVETPLVGKVIEQNRADIKVKRGKNRAKVLSPVSGVVTDVNYNLRDTGNLANQAPYSDGWVLRVHSDDLRRDIKNLMIGNETIDFIENEVDRLFDIIEEEAGPLSVDGGLLTEDISGSLPEIEWSKIVEPFLG